MERGGLQAGDHVALVFPPGIDLSAAFYGCLYAGCVPITVRPPHPQNISTTLPTVKMIVEVSHSACVMTTAVICKLLRSKEAMATISIRNWPPVLDSGFAASAESERDVGWGRVCVFLKRLGKKADSRSLSLAHCDPKATDLLELESRRCAAGGSLRCLPSVGELDLSCNKLLAGGLSRLTFHLAHVTHLERLDLHLCCLTRDDLEALIQVLPSLTALTELDVSSNKEVGGVVHPLVSALPVTQMRRLPFNSCYLSNESFTALALAVPYLRRVDISWCKVVGGHLAPCWMLCSHQSSASSV
uniref:AMP-dependent synthetase/ligase domain-containing protein n=1 Tax=Oreochromis aureus TaxID=47969 RepID=A0AAZ1XEW4_OREAU